MRRKQSKSLTVIFILSICATILAVLLTFSIYGTMHSIAKKWVCESCGESNEGNFCEYCGEPRPKEWTCPNCGSKNEGKFCFNCGASSPNNLPVLHAGSGDNYDVWGTNINRQTVTSVTFLSSQSDAPLSAIDVSEAGDSGVLLWFEEVGDNQYDMYLAANGKMRAPKDCASLFAHYTKCRVFNFNGVLDTSSTTNMAYMFEHCPALIELDLSSFDTSSVSDMTGMTANCLTLSSIDLGSLDTSKVRSMEGMFYNCRKLTELDISSFDTSNVIDMSFMFSGCTKLESLNIGNFVVRPKANVTSMFDGCDALSPSVYEHILPTD